MSNKIILLDPETLQKVADIILNHGVVAIPTETVYGLICDARSASAIARVYQLKKRKSSMPMSVLVGSLDAAKQIAIFTPQADLLAQAFFPGPLTLILKRKDHGTIGIRIPNHPITEQILNYLNLPIIGTSANISGFPSAISANEVAEYFCNEIDLIIDGGEAEIAVHSTIVDLTGTRPNIIRLGAISAAQINAVLNQA